jgi:hypothetical protein
MFPWMVVKGSGAPRHRCGGHAEATQIQLAFDEPDFLGHWNVLLLCDGEWFVGLEGKVVGSGRRNNRPRPGRVC